MKKKTMKEGGFLMHFSNENENENRSNVETNNNVNGSFFIFFSVDWNF